MNTRRTFLQQSLGLTAALAAPSRRPNVVVIYIDDMGYGELGSYGGKLAPTPHLDAMAANGMRFTDGYVAACVCSPSRVGLMTGRYQARTGHDANSGRPGRELDPGEITMAQYMKKAGYATGIAGKWHLGESEEFLPASRGFDFSIGSISNLGEGGFYRGKEKLDTLPGAPVTTPYYVEQACGFMDKNRANPFFLYLPLNNVHAPHVASEKWLAKFSHIAQGPRRNYAAQVAETDEAVGTVLGRLRSLGLEENTLVFCISDNGGTAQSEMGGLRGGKWNLWEGGIRVAWMAQWKGRIRPGQVCREPVIQLDVLPTALAAAGGGVKPEKELDGANLLPLLEGKAKSVPREALYWRFGVQFAVRRGPWKLVKPAVDAKPMLFNVVSDPGEQKELSSAEPARAAELLALWQKWNAGMKPPRWEDRRWDGEAARQRQRGGKKDRKAGRKKKQ